MNEINLGVSYRLSDRSVFDMNIWDEFAVLQCLDDGEIDWSSDPERDFNDGTDIASDFPGEIYPHGVFDQCISASDDQIVDALMRQYEGCDLSKIIFGVQCVDYIDDGHGDPQPLGWRILTSDLSEDDL